MTLSLNNETFRDDYAFFDSPQAIRGFPFAFDQGR